MRWSILGILAAACAAPPLESALAPLPDLVDRDTPIAIINAQVIPMDRERVVSGQTILVRDGRIEAVGPSGTTPVPSDAQVLDADGRYVLPGLADMHVHISHVENLLLYVANGVTTVRNMWGSPPAVLDWRAETADGSLLGPRIHTASPGFDGYPIAWSTSIVPQSPAEAREAVRAEAAKGFDFIKVYNNLRPDIYDAILDEGHRIGIPVVGHVPNAVGLEHALQAGQATTEHLKGYPDDLSNADLAAFARHHATFGTWVCPTMIVRISFVNSADAAELEARDEMRFVHPDERARWAPTPGVPSRGEQRQASRRRGRVLRALRDAGVGILLGTDSWISYVIHGFAVHDELDLLVEDADFTPFEAIAAATRDAAQSVGADGQWGTIVPGASADLVLTAANPLESVRALRHRSGVMVAGTWLSDAELSRRLEDLAGRYAGGGGRPAVN